MGTGWYSSVPRSLWDNSQEISLGRALYWVFFYFNKTLLFWFWKPKLMSRFQTNGKNKAFLFANTVLFAQIIFTSSEHWVMECKCTAILIVYTYLQTFFYRSNTMKSFVPQTFIKCDFIQALWEIHTSDSTSQKDFSAICYLTQVTCLWLIVF